MFWDPVKYIAHCGKSSIFQSFKFFVKTCLFSFFQIKQHPKSKSTMYLNEDHLRPPSNHQGNIVRFLRSLVVSKSKIHNHKSRVFGKDLKQHLAETRNESKIFKIFFRNFSNIYSRNLPITVPPILRVCSKCIEHRGIVDGIYRLSGISSNIRALK